MKQEKRGIRKRKFLEGTGCLLYVVFFAAAAAVFIARCGEVF